MGGLSASRPPEFAVIVRQLVRQRAVPPDERAERILMVRFDLRVRVRAKPFGGVLGVADITK
ncbi:hypothetical protein DV26_09695 [Amycolatopsis mediterranei]|nr:hypothetical protein DV26_09695 [Amycolatopsis mediterranei]